VTVKREGENLIVMPTFPPVRRFALAMVSDGSESDRVGSWLIARNPSRYSPLRTMSPAMAHTWERCEDAADWLDSIPDSYEAGGKMITGCRGWMKGSQFFLVPIIAACDDPEPSVEFFPPGTDCVQCSRCNRLRAVAGSCCPDCRNPEYGLVHIGPDGDVVSGWLSDPEKPVKPKRPRKPKPSSESLPDLDTGPDLNTCHTCGLTWPKSEGVGCPACVHAPAEVATIADAELGPDLSSKIRSAV
jgi:hypothetical protein